MQCLGLGQNDFELLPDNISVMMHVRSYINFAIVYKCLLVAWLFNASMTMTRLPMYKINSLGGC